MRPTAPFSASVSNEQTGQQGGRWRQLSEAQSVAMALGSSVAALAEPAIDVPIAVGALVVALAVRRPWLVVCAVVLVASGRAAVEASAYRPVPTGAFEGTISLVTDPERRTFGWTVEARVLDGPSHGARLRVSVPWSAGDLGGAVAGSRLHAVGSVTTIEDSTHHRSRHLRGGLQVAAVSIERGPRWWRMPSEFIRARVVAGAEGVPGGLRPLYLGLVIGDDREQSLGQQARFRVAGMSHLLAVSGQNVAFVLAVLAPLLARLAPRSRWVATAVVLVIFALATRLEPSVLRATVSAAVAATAVVSGRRSAGVRTLSLAASALVIIDPFLVRSVGFVLSVGASFGIVVFGRAIANRTRGPRPLAEAIGITAAAQIAVAPLLIAIFGPVSIASLPANVAAGWAAGAVMMWGASAGMVVGFLPPSWRSVASAPVSGLVGWVDTVASAAAAVPLPSIGWAGCGVVVVMATAWWSSGAVLGDERRVVARTLGAVSVVVVFVAATLWSDSLRATVTIDGGATFHAGEPSVLIVTGSPTTAVPESLLEQRVRSVDVVVHERGDRWSATVAAAIADVADVGLVLAPPGHRIPGATTVREAVILDTGSRTVRLEPDGNRLVVSIGPISRPASDP